MKNLKSNSTFQKITKKPTQKYGLSDRQKARQQKGKNRLASWV